MRKINIYIISSLISIYVCLIVGCNSNPPTPTTVPDEKLKEVLNLLVGVENTKWWFQYLEADTINDVDNEQQEIKITEYSDSLNAPVLTFTTTEIRIGMLHDGELADKDCSRSQYNLTGDEQGHIIIKLKNEFLIENGYATSDYYEIISISADSLRLRRYFARTDDSQGNKKYSRTKDFCFVVRDYAPVDDTPIDVNDEVSKSIIQYLTNNSNKEWYLYLKTDSITNYYPNGAITNSVQSYNKNLALSVNLWMIFSNMTIQEGSGHNGIATYDSEMSYSIRKNIEGIYFLNIVKSNGKQELYEIVSVDSDSLHLASYTHSDATEIVPGKDAKTDYYWCAFDYAALHETKETVDKMIIEEWLLLQSHTVIDYFDGYTSAQGLTHTDSTIVYTTNYPYMRINEDKTYVLGAYSAGNIALSPTPEDVGIKNAYQTYFTSVNEIGEIEFFFHNFYIRQKDSGYTSVDTKRIVDKVTSDSLIMHQNLYLSTMGVVNGVLSVINVGSGVMEEKWARK